MSAWVLVVGADGRVARANEAAVEALGPCVGRLCKDVIRLLDARACSECTATCALELIGVRGSRDRHGRVARRTTGRVLCNAVGDEVVVTVLPEGEVALTTPLSPREREVLGLVSQGLTNGRIARRLGVRPATVRTHMEHARDKLGARTRAEAVIKALSIGELD